MNVEPWVKEIGEIVEQEIHFQLNYVTPIDNRASYLTRATTSPVHLFNRIEQNP